MAKLSWDLAQEIRARYGEGGVTQEQLAREYGTSQGNVHHVVAGHIWASPPLSDQDRFLAKVEKTTSGCWVWRAGLTGAGYGAFTLPGHGGKKQVGAHVWSYQNFVGEIPAGLELDHTCHDPATCSGGSACPHRRCVNPEHLEPVTKRDNLLRGGGVAAKNYRKTHCHAGHPLSGDNLYNYKNHRRVCRACQKEREQSYRRKQA